MPILRLDFRLRAEAPVTLPPFLGSTLRGAFGNALKKVFCFVPHETTENCWFAEACPYQYIFESKNLGNIPSYELHNMLRGQKEFPHPYVLIPPAPVPKIRLNSMQEMRPDRNFNDDFQPNRFSRGESLNFSLLLIGKAVRHWAHVLVAVRLLASNGLGEDAARAPFSLTAAFAHDAKGRNLEIFSEENKRVMTQEVAPVNLAQLVGLKIENLKDRMLSSGENKLKIEFLTPTSQRILLQGKATGQLGFSSLIKKITERIEFLTFLHSERPQKIDYRSVLTETEDFCLTDNSLHFYRYKQHSERQARMIQRDVFLGNISYQGEKLKKMLPFLKAGEILSVGADTPHGFGRFIIEV